MRAVLVLAIVASISATHSIEEKPRQLRKDYYESSKSSKGSSSKSGKSSSKSSKSGSSLDGYIDGYSASGKSDKSTGKSSKGSSKSGKSSYHSSSYGSGANDKFEGDSKATKYDFYDDNLLDINADDRLTNSGVNFDDVVEDDMKHDDFDDDVEPLQIDGGIVENDAEDEEDVEETTESENSATDANLSEESEGSLQPNSWLTDLIQGNGSTDDKVDGDDSIADDDDKDVINSETAIESQSSMSLKLEDDNESTDADSFANHFAGDTDNNKEDEEIINFDSSLEPESSMSINFKDDLEQNSWLADLISKDETIDDAEMSMGMKEGAGNNVSEVESGSVITVDDIVMELELESSMAFETFESMSSMGMKNENIELEQAELDFGSPSISEIEDSAFTGSEGSSSDDLTDDGAKESEKNATTDLNTEGDNAVAESTGKDPADMDDGNVDDGIIDDSTESTNNGESDLEYLTQDERTQIILQKCNTTPLDRALSMIQIIGNHIDPKDIVSQSSESPQYMAFLWLVYFDDAILCAPASESDATVAEVDGNTSDVTRLLANIRSNSNRALFNNASVMNIHENLDRIMQRYSLAMLYFSFQGYRWTNCSSDRNLISSNTSDECINSEGQELVRFLDSAHECEWFGVTCFTNATGDIDVDQYYPATNLELPGNNLHGYIPEEISLLYTLEVLDLRDNELTGTIPFRSFATMDSLDTLLLSGNDQLYGDATRYCQSSSLNEMLLFETDCTPLVEKLLPAPVKCSCCSSCK